MKEKLPAALEILADDFFTVVHCVHFQEEIETQKQQHEARVMSIRTEEKQKMDKMADDLDQKWRDALREEVRLLKDELNEEYEADKQAALNQLSQQKELDLMAARENWQRKVEDLLEQISLLKQSLELQLSQSQAALQQLQSQFSQEREHLTQQLKELQREHQRREHRLQEAHCCALSTMEEARQHQIRALEERLKQEQREEVHALKEAHRRTLDILRQQSDQELQTLRFELEDEGKAKLASLRAELNHIHATAIEHLKQIHLKEHTVAKRELEKAIEHSRQQEQELVMRLTEMQSEVCSRSNRITDLDHEIHSLNETIDTLTRELEHKGKEVLRVRSEANHQISAMANRSMASQSDITRVIALLEKWREAERQHTASETSWQLQQQSNGADDSGTALPWKEAEAVWLEKDRFLMQRGDELLVSTQETLEAGDCPDLNELQEHFCERLLHLEVRNGLWLQKDAWYKREKLIQKELKFQKARNYLLNKQYADFRDRWGSFITNGPAQSSRVQQETEVNLLQSPEVSSEDGLEAEHPVENRPAQNSRMQQETEVNLLQSPEAQQETEVNLLQSPEVSSEDGLKAEPSNIQESVSEQRLENMERENMERENVERENMERENMEREKNICS
uniref:Uncharacterized protein n=1 Tax=Knipowitschia caucasica TaxID=637954 RepID=A0AAV2MAF3_KNICA